MDKISHTLYTCSVNKKMKVDYLYQLRKDGKFQTVREYKGTTFIDPSFSISIGEPYGSPNRIFIPNRHYFQFVTLLNKSIPLIQSYASELFTDISEGHAEINHQALERFTLEKAMYVDKMRILPCCWSNDASETFTAIDIESFNGRCKIPLEDAIVISQMLSTFDPFTFGMLLLNMIGN